MRRGQGGRTQVYFRVSYASLLSGCTNCDFGFLSLLLREAAVIFLDQLSRHHNLVSAAHAFQTEVCSDTHDFPLATAARMRFFQFYDISYCVFIHSIFLLYSISTYACHLICYKTSSVYTSICSNTEPSPCCIRRSALASIGVVDLLISTSLFPL